MISLPAALFFWIYDGATYFTSHFRPIVPRHESTQKKRDDLAQDLKQGLKREELFLVYQPLVGSEEYDLRGFEALIRWQHPSMGLVRPDIFLSR
ncbi:EAL domain-containing protein [Vibrio sinaloensis]|nr:EAL domain-containing protein [Vibrio sinaloensis]